jgi:KDO2-lipid IV(A) lauroyltransferase
MKNLLTRLGFLFLWLFHWLPLGVQAAVGNALGWLVYGLTDRRKRIARRNLQLCFPDKKPNEIRRLLRQNLIATMRAALEHGLLIWAPAPRLERLIRIEGREHLESCLGEPVIVLAPHFIGLDMGGVRFSMELEEAASMYSRSRNPVVDHYLFKLRSRFSKGALASRHEGIRPLIRIIRSGLPFYYLPDQDYGRRESIFVPFFGIAAATVPALARLAKAAGARVLPAVTRQLPGGQGYVLKFYPAWENYPSGDVEADTRRMNAFIEDRVREMPAQYLWTHRRFKTRPAGEPNLYD